MSSWYKPVSIFLSGFLFFMHPLALLATEVSTGTSPSSALSAIPNDFVFTQDLYNGVDSSQVRMLQIFLNSDSRTVVNSTGPGSPGNETTYFGSATQRAVDRFQTIYRSVILDPIGLTSPSGVIGSRSRSVLNKILDNLRNNIPANTNVFTGTTVLSNGNSNNTSTFNTRPTLSLAVPSSAAIGTQVNLNGTGFSTTENFIKLGDLYAAKADSQNGTSLSFVVPELLGPECTFSTANGLSCSAIGSLTEVGRTYPLSVKTLNGTTTSISFTVATSTATSTAIETLRITTSNIVPATVGSSYSATISAEGGSESYNWSVLYGSLPNGIVARGAVCIASPCKAPLNLSGVPTVAGSYTFIVRVSSGNQYVTKELVINVGERSSTVPTTTTTTGTTGTDGIFKYTPETSSSNTSSSTDSSSKSNLGLALGIVGAAVAVNAIGSAASTAIAPVFGGRITYVQYCTCSASILLFIYDFDKKSVIQLMYTPGYSKLLSQYNIWIPGPQVLGGYTYGSYPCMVYAGTSCVSVGTPIGIIDAIRGIGTSVQ